MMLLQILSSPLLILQRLMSHLLLVPLMFPLLESSASNRVASFNFLAPRPPQTSVVSQSSTSPDDDERLNQLNESQTQEKSPSPSVLDGLSDVVNDACESAIVRWISLLILLVVLLVRVPEPPVARKRELSELLS